MTEQKNNTRFSILVLMIVLAAFSRIIPHLPNFAPIGAMALFGAAYFSKKIYAFLIPLLSLWLSDLVISNTVYAHYYTRFMWFTPGFYWVYGSFTLITLLGFVTVKKVNFLSVTASGIAAALIFFIVTNFGTWAGQAMYPHTIAGLGTCYAAGIPFFWNTLAGDLFYAAILFGGFEFAKSKLPRLAYN